MHIVKIVIFVPDSKLFCNKGIFKTFRCQTAPHSSKWSYCSASQGFGLAQSQFRQSSWNTSWSEKSESRQCVLLLCDYHSVSEGGLVLSGSAPAFTPNTSRTYLPARFPLVAHRPLLWTLHDTVRAVPNSELPRLQYVAETLEHSCGRNSASAFGSFSNSCSISFSSVKQLYFHRKKYNQWMILFIVVLPSTESSDHEPNHARRFHNLPCAQRAMSHLAAWQEPFQRGNKKELKWHEKLFLQGKKSMV